MLKLIDVATMFFLFIIMMSLTTDSDFEKNTSRDNFSAYKGVFAILIMFHHIAQRRMEFYNGAVEGGFFSFYIYIGSLIVADFLLLTGYGVMTSYLKKGNLYFKGYLLDKIIVLLFPWIICNITERMLVLLGNEQPNYFFTISWFIFCILFLYSGFKVAFHNNWKIEIKIFMMSIICLCWIVGIYYLIQNNMQIPYLSSIGLWWIYPVPAFLVGILWAYYKKKINQFLENKARSIGIGLLMLLILNLSLRNVFTPMPSGFIADLIFAVLLILTISYVNIQNKFLVKFGEYSFEFFIIHTLFMTNCLFEPFYQENEVYYLLEVIIFTVICMIPVHYLVNKIRTIIKNKCYTVK